MVSFHVITSYTVTGNSGFVFYTHEQMGQTEGAESNEHSDIQTEQFREESTNRIVFDTAVAATAQ
jgi:hypothetical protein